MLTTERLCSLDSMWNCYAHVPVHSHMSVFPCPQWYFVRHLHQCICQGSVFPSVLLCSIMHMHQCMLGASISTVSLCSQWSSVVHMHMDASCIRCSSLVPSSIAGLFPPYPLLIPQYILYQCDRCPCSPSVWGLMAGLSGFVSLESSLI